MGQHFHTDLIKAAPLCKTHAHIRLEENTHRVRNNFYKPAVYFLKHTWLNASKISDLGFPSENANVGSKSKKNFPCPLSAYHSLLIKILKQVVLRRKMRITALTPPISY